MSYLTDIFQITTEMVEALNKYAESEIDRPQTIERMTTLIEQREKVINKIKPPYTDEEIELGKKVVGMNEEIAEKMESLFTLVINDMNQVKQQKASSRSYINPYGNMQTTDGMYVDSKK